MLWMVKPLHVSAGCDIRVVYVCGACFRITLQLNILSWGQQVIFSQSNSKTHMASYAYSLLCYVLNVSTETLLKLLVH